MKVLAASSLAADTLASLTERYDVETAFDADEDELIRAMRGREVLVFRSGVQITAAVMQASAELKLLVRAGSGLDNVDLDHVRDSGLRLLRVAGMSAEPVAELTFGLMLAVARKVALADRLLRQGRWPKAELGGPLLRGRTLGIVGAGNIGGRVADLGLAWGMRVLGCVADRTLVEPLRARGIEVTDFETVLTNADFLCLHVPLTPLTRHLIGAPELARMKPGSYVVNMARGGVLDEQALAAQLATGTTVVGAALDVHEVEGEGTVSPFAESPNVVLTPHIGGMASDAQALIGARVDELLTAFADGRLDDVVTPAEIVT